MNASKLDLTGTKQYRLTILRKTGRTVPNVGHVYLCGCYCGNLVEYTSKQLRHKYDASRSCGRCQDKPKYLKEYTAYQSMLNRCQNPNTKFYFNYGGRGITVCQRWKQDFLFFLEDLGLCPNTDSSLERIDVDGNYEPSNCKWIPFSEQALNRRSSITYKMEKLNDSANVLTQSE